MNAVFSRELRSYFVTPMGYIYLAVFWFFAGFYFTGTCLVNTSASLSYVFANLFNICLFLIPVLTMRLVSVFLPARCACRRLYWENSWLLIPFF